MDKGLKQFTESMLGRPLTAAQSAIVDAAERGEKLVLVMGPRSRVGKAAALRRLREAWEHGAARSES